MSQPSDPTLPAAPEGLRARNRERTLLRLQQAAWDLVAEQGFDAVTADAVADRAGVSRRTFFNYFPRVELVLQEHMRATIAGLVDRFVARPDDESLRESLAAVLVEPFDAAVLRKAVIVFGQAPESPPARFFLMEAHAAEAAQIAQALRDRGPAVDPLCAQVVAEAVMSAGQVATVAWLEQSGGVIDDSTRQLHLDLLREAFEHLFTVFGSSAVPGSTQES